MVDRDCAHCGKKLARERHADALYCDQNCRKAAHRARHPHVPKPREPKVRECLIESCTQKHYAIGFCAAHWKNLSRYGDPRANYQAAHRVALARWGKAAESECIRCGRRARDLAYQHTAGDAELATPKGSPFSMNPDDYAPMCGPCHSALDRSHGGAQQGNRRQVGWVGKGNTSPFPREWRRLPFARWACADGKRPVRVGGLPASSTDPRTWSTWECVRSSRTGDGVGVMLGDGLGCYDLDHASDDEIRAFVATVSEPIAYVERSMSGHGAHVFVTAPESPGWKRTVNGVSVERYTRARFIRVTGSTFTM